ncbi:hypothetical protein M3607_04920 [Metabacillus litoralis]|nr:hypothetical protein [Metabacillus litoralis]
MEEPKSPRENIKAFIEGSISEAEFLSRRTDDLDRNSYDYPELEILNQNRELFGEFLLKCTLEGRNQFLLNSQIIGMPLNSLYKKYWIHKDKIRFLKGQFINETNGKEKVEIRTIRTTQMISNELYANLAIFTKVPVSWLQKRDPELYWTVEHFNYLSDASFTPEEFKDYLIITEKNALEDRKKHRRPNNIWLYDIRGIILKISEFHNIYLRVAIYESGGFILEVFSEKIDFFDYEKLKPILSPFNPIETGYVDTVIKNRKNPVIICKSRSKNVIIPQGLKKY